MVLSQFSDSHIVTLFYNIGAALMYLNDVKQHGIWACKVQKDSKEDEGKMKEMRSIENIITA